MFQGLFGKLLGQHLIKYYHYFVNHVLIWFNSPSYLLDGSLSLVKCQTRACSVDVKLDIFSLVVQQDDAAKYKYK